MKKSGGWRLCAGTFFTLVSSARKPLTSHSDRYRGIRIPWTELGTLLALARIVTPDIRDYIDSEEKTLKDCTRDLKACINWGGTYFRLGDSASKKAFDDRIKQDYVGCLNKMTEFTNDYLELNSESRKDEFLTKALLDVLEKDDEILPDTMLYARRDGKPISKKDLTEATTVCFEALLLGIWHFVLLGVENNTVGAETYNEWCPPKNGAKRDYEAAIGSNSKRKVNIDFCDYVDVVNEKTDIERTEVVDEQWDYESNIKQDQGDSPQIVNQNATNPVIINISMEQSGNGKQFGYVAEYREKEE